MYKKIFPLYIAILGTQAACLHEFPDGNPVNPNRINVELEVAIAMDWDSDTTHQKYATLLGNDYDFRFVIELYEGNPSGDADSAGIKVKRIVETTAINGSKSTYIVTDTLQLSAKRYNIIAWADFVPKGTRDDVMYNTENMQKIHLIKPTPDENRGFFLEKNAFFGTIGIDMTPHANLYALQHKVTVNVSRPFARYRIVATDYKTYKTQHPAVPPCTTEVSQPGFFPTGFNSWTKKPARFRDGMGYNYPIDLSSASEELTIAEDVIFVMDSTAYSINIKVLTADNKPICTNSNLKIPLKRNRLTVVRGQYLTQSTGGGGGSGNGGGIGIHDSFDHETVINI